MHPGKELERLAKRAGGTLISRKAQHSEWVVRGKTYRISTVGQRPSHIIQSMTRVFKQAILHRERERRNEP